MARKVRVKADSLTTQAPPIAFPQLQERRAYEEAHQVSTIIPGQIYQVAHFLTPSNAQTLLSHFQTKIEPVLSEPRAPKRGEALRTNQRWAAHDAGFARHLFDVCMVQKCAETCSLAQSGTRKLMGLNPNMRVYRYAEGALFGPHYDDSVTDAETHWTSEWTLLIYLTTDNLVGGETAFHVSKHECIAPPILHASALLHRHGNDCLLHEGRAVKSGIKWVLRSDLMYA